MAASGFRLQASMNVARTAAGCAGSQLAGLAFGGATTFGTPISTTEIFNGTAWTYSGVLNSARQEIIGFGGQSEAMACGGYTGSIYSNASEMFNGTVWAAGGAIQNSRGRFVGGGSTTAAFSVGGYNGTTTFNTTEKFSGFVWTNSGNLITARYYHAGGGTQNSAFVTGGYSELTSTEVYDGSTWSARGALPLGRNAPTGFGSSSASGLIFGGVCPSYHTFPVITSQLFDGNIWTASSAYPSQTSSHRMAASGSVATGGLVIGGDSNSTGGVTATAAWIVSYQSYSWMTQPPMSTGRTRHGSAGTSSQDVVVFGGKSLLSTTERWNGTSWAAGGGLSQGNDYSAGTGGSTTALCLGGNNAGYLDKTQSYNGTVWSVLAATLNTARDSLAAAGDSAAALCFGGYTGAASSKCESFNGTTWTDVNVLVTARYRITGCGSQGAALSVGGSGPLKRTEIWDGATWANSGDLNAGNSQASLSGSTASARIAGGINTTSQNCESWSGTTWTVSASINIARTELNNGPSGTSMGMMAIGGFASAVAAQLFAYPVEIYTGAIPITIDSPIFNATASIFIMQFFPPAFEGVVSASAEQYLGPYFPMDLIPFNAVGSFEAAAGVFAPFDAGVSPFSGIASMVADLHVGSVLIQNLPMLTGYGTLACRSGMLIQNLPGLILSGTGQIGSVGRLSVYLPRLIISATGLSGSIGQLAASLPFLTIVSTGGARLVGNADIILPALLINAHGQAVATAYVALVMNPRNLAVSEYVGFSFNSFALFNGQYLAAGAAGIYVIGGGSKDGASNINAELRTGQLAMGEAKPRDVYLAGKSDGQMLVTLSENEGSASNASVNYLLATLGLDRAKVPRGMKPDYLQIGIKNVSGSNFDLDSMEIYAEGLTRKKK